MIGPTDLASYTVAIQLENLACDDEARAHPRSVVMVGKHHNGNAQIPHGIDDPIDGLGHDIGVPLEAAVAPTLRNRTLLGNRLDHSLGIMSER